IQILMGWDDEHLHEFRIGEAAYGPNLHDEGDATDEKKVRLAEVVRREKARFGYVYDFGDNWHHEILVEKIVPPEPGTHYPVCVGGKRNGAPEDCGGVSGYAALMSVLKNPKHEEYEERREWVGDDYDPDFFALDAINDALRRLRVK
ncbi:MAG: plasmid pRiA4b ORF-3 family protein, partial [Deltaproteobacteria bacterium]|nr:plasmid pRiA4b ORF-3 family protein [Deltaproteobacteria bacterium]